MNEYNICTNRTNKDPTAKKALSGGRLGLCQYFVYVFNKYIGRKRFRILNIVIEDMKDKTIYKERDLL